MEKYAMQTTEKTANRQLGFCKLLACNGIFTVNAHSMREL